MCKKRVEIGKIKGRWKVKGLQEWGIGKNDEVKRTGKSRNTAEEKKFGGSGENEKGSMTSRPKCRALGLFQGTQEIPILLLEFFPSFSAATVLQKQLLYCFDLLPGVYISVRKRYLFPPPPSENYIFFPPLATRRFWTPIVAFFSLILPYFAFILPFYFLFSHFLSPFFLFLFPFFHFLIHFPLFFPLSHLIVSCALPF
jgi:hypothetical protein